MIKRFCFFLIFFTNIALGYNAFDEFIVHSEGILECIKEHSSSSYNDSLDQLNLLRKNYDKHSKLFESESTNYLNKSKEDNKIPKILYFIWVGPKQFPEKSLNNIIKWKELHPDHKIYFWTDRLRIFPDNVFDNVIIKSILDFFNENDKDFRKLISFYKESTNYGEKSDLVRYMILKKIGGIYVDHDIKPLRSTSFFVENFSFFCILENIWPMVEQNYIKLSNAYIGTVKESKIIAKTIECIEKNWDISTRRLENLNIWSYSLQQNHPSKEFQNLLKTLVLFRTFLPFTEAVKSTNLEEDQIVLPPQFGAIKQNSSSKFIKSCLIDHSFDGAWTGLSEHKNFELDSKNRKK